MGKHVGTTLPPPDENIGVWTNYIAANSTTSSNLVRDAVTRDVQIRKEYNDLEHFRSSLAAVCTEHEPNEQDHGVDVVFRGKLCAYCSEVFNDKHAAATHAFKKHCAKNVASLYFSSLCMSCLIEFHTRQRLVHHFKQGKPQCLMKMRAKLAPLCPERASEMDADDACTNKTLARREENITIARKPAHGVFVDGFDVL
jgi:hypothetical protein